MELTLKWCLQYALINLTGWLLVFGCLLLLANYMQEGAISYIGEAMSATP